MVAYRCLQAPITSSSAVDIPALLEFLPAVLPVAHDKGHGLDLAGLVLDK